MDNNELFPILGTKPKEYIPWECIQPHEEQALKNHGQTLKRLAERGGLDWTEALAVLEDRKWMNMDESEAKEKVLEITEQKEWIVPVTWEMCGLIKVKAKSASDAFNKVKNDEEDYELPLEKNYVDGSFTTSYDTEEMIEDYTKMYKEGKIIMKPSQYVIENLDNSFVVRWGENPILFDSQEEAEEFIDMFPKFFKGCNYKLSKGIYFLDNSINYKDIPKEKLEEQKEME